MKRYWMTLQQYIWIGFAKQSTEAKILKVLTLLFRVIISLINSERLIIELLHYGGVWPLVFIGCDGHWVRPLDNTEQLDSDSSE